MKIKIISKNIIVEAELNNSELAKKIYSKLPFSSIVNTWGEEIYFEIPVKSEIKNGQEEVNVGDIGYWPPGSAFCIFFGKTPASTSNKPKAASKIEIFGKIIKNIKILNNVRYGDEIKVEKND